jgi:hypothetical protein
MVLVVALVLVAAASGATAATLITGKQIKDNTVASVDIRDNTVTSADIKNGTVTGNDVANGTIDKVDLAAGATRSDLTFDGHVLVPTIPDTSLIETAASCVGYDARNTSVFGSLALPVGAQITGFDAAWIDQSDTADVQVRLWRRLGLSFEVVPGGQAISSDSPGFGTSASGDMSETVDPGEQFMVEFIFSASVEPVVEGGFCGIEVHLS